MTNGTFQFAFTNSVGALFGVLATTNLSLPLTNWTTLGGATEISPGQFQFADPQETNNSLRFYKILSPKHPPQPGLFNLRKSFVRCSLENFGTMIGIDISPMPLRHGQTPARRLHLPESECTGAPDAASSSATCRGRWRRCASSRRLNLRTGPSSLSAASRTRCRWTTRASPSLHFT